MLAFVKALDRRLGLGVGVHLHEPESLRAVRLPVDDDLGVANASLEDARIRLRLGGEDRDIAVASRDEMPDRRPCPTDVVDHYCIEGVVLSICVYQDGRRRGANDRRTAASKSFLPLSKAHLRASKA